MPSRYRQSFCRNSNSGRFWIGRLLRQRPQDALRPAGGARRIQHRGADAFVRDRRVRQARGASRRPTMRSLSPVAIGDDAELDLGAFLHRLARDIEFCPRGDQDARLAVVEDVGELARASGRS